MTQRDFEALAGVLARQRPPASEIDAYALWQSICRDVARVCAASNPRFSPDRFYTAAARKAAER